MQTLSLQPRESDPFVVLKATGEIDLHNQDEFERVINELLVRSPVVVDLSELEFFAISALRSLIVCHRTAVATGHELSYCEPPKQLLRLVTLSGLVDVLPVDPPLAQDVVVG